MARRPIFVPTPSGPKLVKKRTFEFTWYPGFSPTQAQKSIASLHEAAAREGIESLLEISSKSKDDVGKQLSAFNLHVRAGIDGSIPVEAAYQGSKVFSKGEQYTGIYRLSGRDAKRDPHVYGRSDLIEFRFCGEQWPLEPQSAFYDWLYIKALSESPALSQQLDQYNGFSDIAFNPDRSINCQARAAARFVALQRRHLLERAMLSKEAFLAILAEHGEGQTSSTQPRQYLQEDLL